jgi:hypothetical protein
VADEGVDEPGEHAHGRNLQGTWLAGRGCCWLVVVLESNREGD